METEKTKCDLCKKSLELDEAISTENFVLCDGCFKEVGSQYYRDRYLE